MKRTNKLFIGLLTAAVLFLTSCEESNFDFRKKNNGILPERFSIDIPNSISNNLKSTSFKNTETDTLNGNAIYGNLANFIAIGEASAILVESIIWHINLYNIDNVIELTYTSDEDNRIKHLSVIADAEFQGKVWEYKLTVTDVDSEGNEDGGIGMQVYWNNSPISGIAILKPYNINRDDNEFASETIFSIEYSEDGILDYDAYMEIQIAGLPTPGGIAFTYSVDNLKMFVGKKGDIVDVWGNSNHPNAQFFTEEKGFNWAFIASGNDVKNIGVAEVGLPSDKLNSSSREVLLKDYSIKNVLTDEINTWFLETLGFRPNEDDLANYLKNADAPGYFSSGGFVQGGTAPSTEYKELESRLENLTPFNPSEISNLQISFN